MRNSPAVDFVYTVAKKKRRNRYCGALPPGKMIPCLTLMIMACVLCRTLQRAEKTIAIVLPEEGKSIATVNKVLSAQANGNNYHRYHHKSFVDLLTAILSNI